MFTTKSSVRLFVALIISAIPLAVFAAKPHFKGRDGKPACVINADGTWSCSTGAVAGLGNEDVLILIDVTGTAGQFCKNPGNGNIVPGQNPATASDPQSQLIDADDIKNGNLILPAQDGSVTVEAGTTEQAGCPNGNWEVLLGPVTYSGTYVIQQPPGTTVLSFTF